MKKKTIVALVIAVVLIGAVVAAQFSRRSAPTSVQAATAPLPELVAGPGRVEPSTEDIKLGSELSGKLKAVYVEEGDAVKQGQVLAELVNNDYRAQVLSAEADVAAKTAALRKVENGARAQERREAYSSVLQMQAVMNNARAEADRRQKLYAAGVISREEADRYSREYDVAKARYEEAREHHSLVDDRAREEDHAMAVAELKLSQARLEQARAMYAKTLIKSPVDGTVLRKHHRNGESVSNSATVPDPVITVGDKRVMRVRMEVDETDISRVQVGQKAYVMADTFGQQKFPGKVIRVGQQLGRKNIVTGDPAEKVDNKVLETLIELDAGNNLPVGLRVDAYVETSSQTASMQTMRK